MRIGMVLTLAAFFASCSKSTSPGGTAPTLNAPTLSGPVSSASADTSKAAYLADSIATTFDFTAGEYVSLLTGHTGSQSGSTWTWSYTDPQTGLTITWTATSVSNGYDWKLVENGTSSGITFNNWTALNGYESSDGKTGNWTLYYPGITQAADSAAWSTDANGTLSGTIVAYSTSGAIANTFVFTNDNIANHTGDLKIYVGPVSTTYEDISWTASGGTWTIYYDGVAVSQGSW